MSNRLSREKSPYLWEHAENPVDWYPWGEEAFEKARREDRPIFLSIGYSSCHWCHVMARESFENGEVARFLNGSFVSIKVDREERPDIDALYMAACQALTGQGGWPLSVFLTADRRPFFAGTYFPTRSRGGRPGFVETIESIARLWASDRRRIDEVGDQLTELLSRGAVSQTEAPLGPEALDRAFTLLRDQFDDRHGGFGDAPKFPIPHRLSFLLRYHRRTGNGRALQMVTETLTQMRRGGLFDQIGFGFHRYAVDERWRVPHFEKMLTDQALIAAAYIEAFQATGDPFYEGVAREVFTYVMRNMTSRDGGFFTAEDADSEGEEGKYYLWSKDEIERILPKDDAELVIRYFNVKREGNISPGDFPDGANILFVRGPSEEFAGREGMGVDELARVIERARHKLLAEREIRPRPKRDDKIVTALNGLMIAAFARGYGVFGDRTYLSAAIAAADFILGRLADGKRGLLRRFRDGEAGIGGFLEDYAFFVWGLIELYEAGFDVRYLEEAVRLTRAMLALFRDEEGGGLFTAPRGQPDLIAPMKEVYDGAVPSGNSVAALNIARLSQLTGDNGFLSEAERIVAGFSSLALAQPDAYSQLLCALDFILGPSQEIVIVGGTRRSSADEMIRAVRGPFLPNKTLIFVPHGDEKARGRVISLAPHVSQLAASGKEATVYLCEDHSCRTPSTDVREVAAALMTSRCGGVSADVYSK